MTRCGSAWRCGLQCGVLYDEEKPACCVFGSSLHIRAQIQYAQQQQLLSCAGFIKKIDCLGRSVPRAAGPQGFLGTASLWLGLPARRIALPTPVAMLLLFCSATPGGNEGVSDADAKFDCPRGCTPVHTQPHLFELNFTLYNRSARHLCSKAKSRANEIRYPLSAIHRTKN